MNGTIIIPARRDSKGVPHKNRLLLRHTLSKIPLRYHQKVIISTNDDVIATDVENNYSNCILHRRSEKSAVDTASTIECIKEAVTEFSLTGDIVMLYLTYPERTWEDIEDAWEWYVEKEATSMLCKEEADTHPYLCMFEKENDRGTQIVQHNLCRRQDYPPCFKICHMISIFNILEMKNLNKNLYNNETAFYEIPEHRAEAAALDIDTPRDLEKLKKKYIT